MVRGPGLWLVAKSQVEDVMTRISGLLAAGVAAIALAACGEKPKDPPAPELGPDTAQAGPMLVIDYDESQGDLAPTGFYADPPAADVAAKPGAFLRSEALPADMGLEQAAKAERFIYVSTNGLNNDNLALVGGAVFLPKGEPPAGGWPLIAWAHGTVGVSDACAPSKNSRSERDKTYLNHWLSQGYAVVASDYQGLGTPGGHPYLATRPEAYSVLDSIRAVQSQPGYGLAKSVVIVGQSQGGGAAFATAGEAAAYAPELDIRGSVATGTPYFTATSAPAVRDPNKVSGVFAYSLYILYLVEQADPDFKIADYVSEKARPVMETTRTACLRAAWDQIEKEGLNQTNAFVKDPTPVTAKYYPLMAYSTLKVKGPVFMGTGGKDEDVPPPGQERLFNDACAAGSVIERHVYPELNHSGTVNGSLADSTPFVKKAFAGEAITGNCPKAG